jgi:outer membrane receptor protein involved in Fe transport
MRCSSMVFMLWINRVSIKNYHFFRLPIIATAIFAMTSISLFAEEEMSLFEMSFEDLLKIEVTSASKIAMGISEAPAVITVYTRDHMNDYGFEVINDLLFSLASFSPSHDFDRPTVSSRGNFDSWSNNHLLHLVDGIPMNDNLYGSAYTWFTPIFTTKTMEVIRGPGSALYGSNATNGVIQMNTLKAADLDKSIYAKLSFSGSDNTARREFMTGSTSGDYDFIMAYSFHETNGNDYTSYDGSGRLSGSLLADGTPQASKFTVSNNANDSYLWAKFSVGDNWQFQYHRQEWGFDTGHGWVFWIPDFDDEMNESRDIFSVKYNANINEQWSQEYVMRYQKHDITWLTRFYPDDAFDGFYPSGMWEYLDTDAEDIFGRAQFTYLFSDESNATFLAGIELNRFTYDGDNEHYSNINVDSIRLEPFENDINTPLLPWLDYIKDEPVINTAIYAQLTTGNWLHDDFQVTVGVRTDSLSVDYNEVYGIDPDPDIVQYVYEQRGEARPALSKTYSKFSPRLAGVWTATKDLVLKIMWGKAFRAPTPAEMAGAHSFTLASNIGELEAELMTTTEFQVDWSIDPNHVFRANVYSTEFENQIAYSTANANLATNIYSTKNLGYEFEFIGNYGDLNWFANLSHAARLNEEIVSFYLDDEGNPDPNRPEFSEHVSDIKWVPSTRLNAGIAYGMGNVDIALIMHYQGEVERRDSDSWPIPFDCDLDGDIEPGTGDSGLPLGVCVPDNFNLDGHRGTKIEGHFIFDGNMSYLFSEGLKLNLKIKNLLGEVAKFNKTGPYPFDYQRPGRQILLSIEVEI